MASTVVPERESGRCSGSTVEAAIAVVDMEENTALQ